MKTDCYPLLVAGAGVAGCCAAIAAARQGVRTLLVETGQFPGGVARTALIQHICGLYLNSDGPPEETMNSGLCREIEQMVMEREPGTRPIRMGRVYLLPCSGERLARLLHSLVLAEPHITMLTGSSVAGAEMEADLLKRVVVESPDGRRVINVSAAIDCTGDASLASLAGAELLESPPEERQLAGFSASVSGVSVDETLSIKVPYFCARWVEQGLLPAAMRFTTFTPSHIPGEGVLKSSVDCCGAPESRETARHDMERLLELLRKEMSQFVSAVAEAISPAVAEREGGRVAGEYILQRDDLLSARKFDDGVVKGAWPMEFWDRQRGPQYQYPPRGEYYEIPLRCLKARGIANLLIAGRCISASSDAIASTRVTGICMALGEQAGIAAAGYLERAIW